MEGEAGVLQQRVEPAAVDRGRIKTLERVGGEQQEGEETERQSRLGTEGRPQGRLIEPPFE